MVSKELLDELKIIIEEEYGKDLDSYEVSELGNMLVEVFHLLMTLDKEDKKLSEEVGQNEDSTD